MPVKWTCFSCLNLVPTFSSTDRGYQCLLRYAHLGGELILPPLSPNPLRPRPSSSPQES
jgi:hypothetical protein